MGGPKFGQDYGAVSSLSFNLDASRLLVGFSKGKILVYDVISGKLQIALSEDAHPLGSAILHARFTDQANLALVCDSGGSVFEITFRKTAMMIPGSGSYTSRCVFSGSRGEVCTIEPLSLGGAAAAAADNGGGQFPGSSSSNHSLSEHVIVAFATISKLIVLSLRPSMKVLFTHALVGRSDTLPVISWQFVTIQTTNADKVVDPVIAFGRQSTIYFYQVSSSILVVNYPPRRLWQKSDNISDLFLITNIF